MAASVEIPLQPRLQVVREARRFLRKPNGGQCIVMDIAADTGVCPDLRIAYAADSQEQSSNKRGKSRSSIDVVADCRLSQGRNTVKPKIVIPVRSLSVKSR